MKQSVGCIDADTLTLLTQAPPGFAVLGGDDAYLFPLTFMRAAAAIAASANLQTHRFVAMIDHGLAGEVTSGRKHAEALLPLVRELFAEPSPAVIKALLHGRTPTPDVRMPLSNASATAVKRALAARPL